MEDIDNDWYRIIPFMQPDNGDAAIEHIFNIMSALQSFI